jgi:hypothetical protein
MTTQERSSRWPSCGASERWYRDRLDPEWTPHDRARNQRDLAAADLDGEYWQLR